MDKSPITYEYVDTDGIVPDVNLKGTRWVHTGNNRLYVIHDFLWHGDDDKWHVFFGVAGESKMCFTRSYRNFFGRRDASPRFVQVKQSG